MPMKPMEYGTPVPRVRYDREELRERLDPIQFNVTQEKGTERPFKNKYYKHYEDGTYTCVVCGIRLFNSDTKYDSGSGWPSFYDVIDADKKINTRPDTSGVGGNLLRIVHNPGLIRTEVTCKKCGSHLGHVFKDGPQPTGIRYCINSSSLNFVHIDDDDGEDNDEEEEEEADAIDGEVNVKKEVSQNGSINDDDEIEEDDEDDNDSGGSSSTATSRDGIKSARKSFFSSMTSKNNKKNKSKNRRVRTEIISFPATLGGCGPNGMCAIKPRKAATPTPKAATPIEGRDEKEQSV